MLGAGIASIVVSALNAVTVKKKSDGSVRRVRD